jgi:hypothetical protein
MFGPTSLARLETVHPVLKEKVIALESQMSESLAVVQATRNDTEQAALFAQGRSPLAVVNHLRQLANWAPITDAANKKAVTKAKPGYSWHTFGLAVDLAPENPDGTIDWNDQHPVWGEMIEKGEALGMVSGRSFEDDPHFQLTGRFPVTPTDEVRSLMQSGGMQAVWDATGIQEEKG